MSISLRRPHETKTVAGVARLVRENFTARLVRHNQAPLTIQNGHVFDDGGREVKDIPAWLWEEFAKLSVSMREKLQLTTPANKKT